MSVPESINDNILCLQKNTLFHGLTEQQLELLLPLIEEVTLYPGDFLIHEGEKGNEFYILKSGEVEVLKKEPNSETTHRLTILYPGEAIGEVALVETTVRTASIRAVTPATLLKFPINKIQTLSLERVDYEHSLEKLTSLLKHLEQTVSEPPILTRLTSNLARALSDRLFNTNVLTVQALKKELQQAKTRITMGKFMINVISLIIFYLFSLKTISYVASHSISTTVVSVPLIIIFAAVLIIFIINSGYPLSTFGLTFNNWQIAIAESLFCSFFMMLGIVILKWIFIHTIPSMADKPLLQFQPLQTANVAHGLLAVGIIFYLIFTPVQELIVRGCLQSSLEEFLVGPRKTFLAIVISNLLFAGTHLHVSLGLALFVFLPGLVWGWLYSRHRTLVGVSISHLIVGGFAFFIVGIKMPM